MNSETSHRCPSHQSQSPDPLTQTNLGNFELCSAPETMILRTITNPSFLLWSLKAHRPWKITLTQLSNVISILSTIHAFPQTRHGAYIKGSDFASITLPICRVRLFLRKTFATINARDIASVQRKSQKRAVQVTHSQIQRIFNLSTYPPTTLLLREYLTRYSKSR